MTEGINGYALLVIYLHWQEISEKYHKDHAVW